MDDSQPVEIDLDTFEKDLYGADAPKVEEKEEEVSEPTPSATNEESDSTPEGDQPDEEVDIGDDTPEESEAEEEEAEQPKPKKRKSAQERINDLTREKYELQRLLDLERQERERNRDQKSEEKPTPAVTSASEGAPDPDAMKEDGTPLYPLGEYDKDFVADLTRYTIKHEREAFSKQEAEDKLRTEAAAAERELTDNWNAKVEASAERLPDLKEKFGTLQTTFRELPEDYGNFLASSIMTLENGPDVLAYLADNLDIAKQVVDSGAFGAVISLGRLDEKFSSKSEEVEKGVTPKVTQAPTPPPKNKGSAVAKTIRPDTDNLDDFEKIFYEK